MFGRSSSGTVEGTGERRGREEEGRTGERRGREEEERERRREREGVDESCEKPFACFDFMFDVVYQPCIVN